jgi:hypothetical protein
MTAPAAFENKKYGVEKRKKRKRKPKKNMTVKKKLKSMFPFETRLLSEPVRLYFIALWFIRIMWMIG